MTQINKQAADRMPVLRAWQAFKRQAGPFQVPDYEDFAALVQEHEALAAALDAAEARERAGVALLQEIATSGRCDFQKVRDTLAAIRQETNDG
jgi:hypothetical protein